MAHPSHNESTNRSCGGSPFGVTLLVVNLIGDLVNAALGIEPRAAIGVPIAALFLWYLSSRKVKAYFCGSAGPEAAAA